MDRLDEYRAHIRTILTEHARIPPTYGEMRFETVFDRDTDRYVLMLIGFDQDGRRANAPIIHVDIIDGKIWIQYDGTEYGVAQELADAGVPKDKIVLGFWPPEIRKRNKEFAAA